MIQLAHLYPSHRLIELCCHPWINDLRNEIGQNFNNSLPHLCWSECFPLYVPSLLQKVQNNSSSVLCAKPEPLHLSYQAPRSVPLRGLCLLLLHFHVNKPHFLPIFYLRKDFFLRFYEGINSSPSI